jgi:hypothetical protein
MASRFTRRRFLTALGAATYLALSSPVGCASLERTRKPRSLRTLVMYLTQNDPPGRDQRGYAFGLIVLVLLTALSEVVALVLGIAGTLQRHRKRMFALAGVARSVLVLTWVNSEVELGHFILGIPELFDPPEIHHSKAPPEG